MAGSRGARTRAPAAAAVLGPVLLGLALVAGLAWPAAVARGAVGCDTVPAEYAGRTNPVPELSDAKLRYWAKQYQAKCAHCHGAQGDGGGEDAKLQKVPPANFTDAAFMAACSDGQLFYQILVGGEERSAMPGFGPGSAQGWSEEKVWEMARYIRRFAAGR